MAGFGPNARRAISLFGALGLVGACRPSSSLFDASIAREEHVSLLGFLPEAETVEERRCALAWSTGTLPEGSFPVDAPADLRVFVVTTETIVRALRVARPGDDRLRLRSGAELDEGPIVLSATSALGLPELAEGESDRPASCPEAR